MLSSNKKTDKHLWYLGGAIVLLWVLITWLSHGIAIDWLPATWQAGFAYEIENDLTPTSSFLVLFGLSWGLLLLSLRSIRPAGDVSSKTIRGIVGIALLLRLIALCGEPIHENDFYRYIWDGHVSLSGVNPYWFSPDSVGESWILNNLRGENSEFHSRIGHSEIPTIYPPLAQVVFALTSYISGWSVFGWKGMVVFFDGATLLLLIAILRRLGRNPVWVILYGWNPLVIKEFANSAHFDVIPIFFCLLALFFALGQGSIMRKSFLIGVSLGLGTLAKYFAILLLPVLLIHLSQGNTFRSRLRSPGIWLGSAAFAGVVILGFVPYFLWDDVGIEKIFAGLRAYTERWQYSPGIFALIERSLAYAGLSDHFILAKVIVATLLAFVVTKISWRKSGDSVELAETCFVVMSALFVLLPTAFPWYYCWVLAFAVFTPRFSWVLLGALLPLNYLDFHSATDIPLAHMHWIGLFLIPASIWISFALAWFGERHFFKSS